jgi:hypothetical protein
MISANEQAALISVSGQFATRIECASDCTSLVAAYALPLVEHGYIGFDFADLRLLLRSTAGVFFNLPLKSSDLPTDVQLYATRASGAFAVFLGDDFTLCEVSASIGTLDAVLPPHVHRIFAAALVPNHEARLLLTLFG